MLTYNLEERNNTPLYEYIYECIKKDILTGNIKADEKLPSKRLLANNLSVSLITVENAYEQLIYEGYIYAIEKKGYYASKLELNSFNAAKKINPPEDYKKTYSSKNESLINNKDYVDFQTTLSDRNIFPFSTWAKITRKTLLDEDANLLIKSESQGTLRLRQSVASYLRAYKGMSVNPDNIIIGAGMEYLYGLVLQLLGRNKMIAVEDPGHTKVSRIFEMNGTRVLPIPLDSHGFNPAKLTSANISCIHISPSHQFPTGIVMPVSRRHKLIEEAVNKNFYILEDDYDSELRFDGKPLQAMASLAPDKVIYMNTFSKTLMNAVRIAYMVLPDKLMNDYHDKLSFYSCTVSALEQLTLSTFIDEGYYERHINRTRLHYKKCKNNFVDSFEKSRLANAFSILDNNAGLHLVIKANENIDDKLFIEKLKDSGILMNSLISYCNRPDKRYEHLFLINYFKIEENELIEIFNTIYSIAKACTTE